MRRLFLLLSLIISMYVSIYAQTNVDSLVNVLETEKTTVEEQLALYIAIYDIYVLSDLQKASEYAEKGLKLARKAKNKTMESGFNSALGRVHTIKSNYDIALDYWQKALDLAIYTKNKDQEATIYLGIGILSARQEEHTSALEYFIKALSIYEDLGDKLSSATIMVNIAIMQRGMANYERALYYLEKARCLAEEINYVRGKIKIYFELSVHYSRNIADQKDPAEIDQALKFGLYAYDLCHELNEKSSISPVTEILAEIYSRHLKDYDMALKYALEGLNIAEEIGDPRQVCGSLNSISNIYYRSERYRESEEAAFKAWDIDSTNVNIGANILKNIVYANIALGEKEKASLFFRKYEKIIEELINENNRKTMLDMEVKYETEKKETRISTLEKEKQLYIWLSIAGGIVLLLAFGVLFYRHRLNVHKMKHLEQEKQLIATQSILDGETAERSRLARDLHDGLGGMLSVVKLNLKEMRNYSILDGQDVDRFSNALGMLDQSITELRRVAHHMMPESLMRYGLKISIEDFSRAIPNAHFQYYGSEERLDDRLEVILYRCVYELVNNAVKYAEATAINVQLMIDNGLVSITVQDNGIGFDPEKVTSGSGLDNIRTRVSAYNGKMTIHSSPGNGTEVSVEIENQA